MGIVRFGVGCFAFEWRKPVAGRGASEWKKDVEHALSALPNISSIVCDVPSDSLAWDEHGRDWAISPVAYPQPSRGIIQFEISILRRHQSLEPGGQSIGENFRVTVEYGYEGPVAFVRPLDTTSPGSASTSVMVVRKYLAKHLLTDEVQFSMVGPSPFHAEFTLEKGGSNQNRPLTCVIEKSRGYDDVTFRYDPQSFTDESEGHHALRTSMVTELSLYYSLVRAKNYRLHQAVAIGGKTEELIDLHTQAGWKARLKRLFLSGSQARDLSLAVMDAEFTAASDREDAEEAVKAVYKGDEGFLQQYVQPLADQRVSSLVANGRNVVTQLEAGRTKEMEVTLLAGSTVAGAIAGAVASAILNA